MGIPEKSNNKNTADFYESIISEWRAIFDSITDLVSVLDTDYRFVRVNRPLAAYLGVEPQDLIGKKCYEVMHGTDRPVSYCPMAESASIKCPIHKEVYDSTLKKHFMINLSPIIGKDGNVQSIVHVMRDITERKIVEKSISMSEVRLKSIINNTSAVVYLKDMAGKFLMINREFENLFHISNDEISGKTDYDLFPKEQADAFRENDKSVLETGTSIEFDEEVLHDDGVHTYISIKFPLFDHNGKAYGVCGISTDISERKQWERELQLSEKQLAESQRVAKLGSWEWDIAKNEITWSDELYRIFGVKPSEFDASYETFLSMVHPDDRDRLDRAVKESVEKRKSYYIDVRIQRSDGSEWIMEARGELTLDDNGNAVSMGGTAQDITVRKKAELELKESEEKYRKLIETANDAILLADSETGIILDANKKAEDLLGIPIDMIKGMHQTELHPEEELEHYREIFETHVREGNAFISDLIVVNKSGRRIPVDISASQIEINGKKVLQGVFRDISERKKVEEESRKNHNELEMRVQERTLQIERAIEELLNEINERKEAEEALRQSEERFRIAATATSDLLWEGDVRENSLDWYGNIDWLLGYGEGEFPRTISGHMESIHPDDREWFTEKVDKALKTGNEFIAEYRIRCKDGTYRYWNETGKAVVYEDGKAVKWIGSVTDITDRKIAEDQIIKSENQFKKLSQEFNALLDAIPDNIILLDSDLKVLWANKASSQKFNKVNSEPKGLHCYRLCCNSAGPCTCCPAIASFNSGREETARVSSPSGIVWDIRAFPIMDNAGNVKNVIEVARDVSVRVRLEKEAGEIQAKLIQTNKMTSLGTLVSGVAHEINNPNSFIMTNADLFNAIWKDVYKKLKEQDRNNEHTQFGGIPFSELETVVPTLLRGIYEGSGRIKNIVDNLKDFAKSDKRYLYEKVDVNRAVRTASSILDSHIKQCTDNYYLSCKDSIPYINGNSQQIEQVVINLIMNSLQALPDRESSVIVSTYCDSENGLVVIKVEDEGTGISESVMDRITEPFFTTKMESGGTGLGLSISYSIINEHSGSLEFMSEENTRTAAFIKLPACSDVRND